jgi:hypothetical protein
MEESDMAKKETKVATKKVLKGSSKVNNTKLMFGLKPV